GGVAGRTRSPGRRRAGDSAAGADRHRQAGAETGDAAAAAHPQGGRAQSARCVGGSNPRAALSFLAHRTAAERNLRQAAAFDDRFLGRRGFSRRHDRSIAVLHRHRADVADLARRDRTPRALCSAGEAQAPGADAEGVAMMAQLENLWRERPWLRRAIFVAGNFIVAVMIAAFVVMPVQAFFAERDVQILSQRTLLARFAAIAAQRARVQAAAREADAQVEHGEFIVGTNEGVIVADLQTRLKAMAEAAGARLRSVQSLPPKTREEVRYVGARLEVHGSIAAIQRT